MDKKLSRSVEMIQMSLTKKPDSLQPHPIHPPTQQPKIKRNIKHE